MKNHFFTILRRLSSKSNTYNESKIFLNRRLKQSTDLKCSDILCTFVHISESKKKIPSHSIFQLKKKIA